MGRRAALRGLLLLLLGLLLAAWQALARLRRGVAAPSSRLTLPMAALDGTSFHGEVVLVRRGGELRGLSARCPHLGCRIDQLDGEALLCPCHGSRFDLEGRPLTGPARGELTRLQLHPGSVAGTVDVHLPS